MFGAGTIVNDVADVAVWPFTVMLIGPVVAPTGTVAVTAVTVAAVTVAATPLNFTAFSESVPLKYCPLSVTLSPACPEAGEKPVMDGGGSGRVHPTVAHSID